MLQVYKLTNTKAGSSQKYLKMLAHVQYHLRRGFIVAGVSFIVYKVCNCTCNSKVNLLADYQNWTTTKSTKRKCLQSMTPGVFCVQDIPQREMKQMVWCGK